jgi:hypothetical protein
VPWLDPHPAQLDAVQPPHDEPAEDENVPEPVEKLTTDMRRETALPWHFGHSTSGFREKTNSSKSLLQSEQWYS